jgi:hypothetical protein
MNIGGKRVKLVRDKGKTKRRRKRFMIRMFWQPKRRSGKSVIISVPRDWLLSYPRSSRH